MACAASSNGRVTEWEVSAGRQNSRLRRKLYTWDYRLGVVTVTPVHAGIQRRHYRGKCPPGLSSSLMQSLLQEGPDFGTQSNKCSLDITCKTVTIPDFRSECNPDETENNYESSRNHYRAQDLAFPTDHRPGTSCRPVADCPSCRRSPAGGRRTRSRQNQGDQGSVQGD